MDAEEKRARHRASVRKWQQEHPDEARRAHRRWTQANRDHVNAKQRERREDPNVRAQDNANSKAWRQANPQRARHNSQLDAARRRAKTWQQRGWNFATYDDYLAAKVATPPMCEESFNLTRQELDTLLAQADAHIQVLSNGTLCPSDLLPEECTNIGAWKRTSKTIHNLAGWLRSFHYPADDARQPEHPTDWTWIESLHTLGYITYRYGVPRVTEDGQRIIDACGGMYPQGLAFNPKAPLPANMHVKTCPAGR